MIAPKTIYRKLDSVLTKIGKKKSGQNFLFSILAELEKTFGETLSIENGRLYARDGSDFVLIRPDYRDNPQGARKKIAVDSKTIQKLSLYGNYIYDRPGFNGDSEFKNRKKACVPAAFTVEGAEGEWIFVFDLKNGWSKEEVTFCLNAVRAAINHRLFSEAIKSELEQAAQIQQSLLPIKAPPQRLYDIAARSQPAKIVGGDFYDFFQFEPDVFGIITGDASGHGLPAALLVRDVITGLRMVLTRDIKMVKVLKTLNQVIQKNTISTRFVSLFYGEVEIDGNFTYVNAGHPPPVLVRGREISELKPTGTILGALPDISLYRAYAQLDPKSVLVFYSDGIIERKNEGGELFGVERLKKLISKNQSKSARKIMDEIFATAYKFGNEENWVDDATVVVIKRKPA